MVRVLGPYTGGGVGGGGGGRDGGGGWGGGGEWGGGVRVEFTMRISKSYILRRESGKRSHGFCSAG